MPKPQEICIVEALGQRYDIWTTVEVWKDATNVVDHALLTVAENSTGAKNFSQLKLKPGDPASITLAGKPALNGYVYLRQASYSAKEHGVQIGISSSAQPIMPSTVHVNPGQYINQTLQQIGSAVFGQSGVGFQIVGKPGGAEIPFERVSEHIGEEKYAFIERLCRMRNIHMIDSGDGTIIGFRGASPGSLVLQEGGNIERARLLLKNPDSGDRLVMTSDYHGDDSGDMNRDQNAEAAGDPSVKNRLIKMKAEMPGRYAEIQMRANHEADWVKFQMVDGDVTVPGWLTPDGSLWMAHDRELVTVNSPMLLPEDSMEFMIKGVVHRQSTEQGTTTDVLLCRFDGLGSGTGEPLAMQEPR
jgi:prophage tail gpP-like protein